MKLYVGNLSYQTTEDELRREFEAFGGVDSVAVITDRDTGRPKGFAFVEMGAKAEADAAIAGLNGKMLNERTIVVNEARPKADTRSGGGSYGDRRTGGGGGSYNDRRGGGGSGGGRGGQRRY